jgi:hypothetical protein
MTKNRLLGLTCQKAREIGIKSVKTHRQTISVWLSVRTVTMAQHVTIRGNTIFHFYKSCCFDIEWDFMVGELGHCKAL